MDEEGWVEDWKGVEVFESDDAGSVCRAVAASLAFTAIGVAPGESVLRPKLELLDVVPVGPAVESTGFAVDVGSDQSIDEKDFTERETMVAYQCPWPPELLHSCQRRLCYSLRFASKAAKQL